MADTVTSQVVRNNNRIYKLHLTNVSDGTGESNVAKIDRSTLTAIDGAEPSRIDIAQIRWAIQGFTYVKLSFDHDADDTALILSGNGYDDFIGQGFPGAKDQQYRQDTALQDPASTGGTGDLLLTTAGAASDATYDITITCHLVP